ncbi:MAG: CDP-diacylglycerol--glycerol-3-phosphate 3-phosphatidyltransferase [Candidatus Omnitrophica bacterium CG07_land_8_20_14_0_80_50_8]|nr:MAG: CDP-diacylglycerol--glycerol-3-phosphate 3-phosphatidyltransferase [Candidatus Omnitrophica bacterium CG07_land_8_20_14_0_80_50_8]
MNPANRLTVLRIVLVPVFIASLLYYSPDKSYFYFISLTAFLLACLTDALDGYLARKLNQNTVLGSYLDPIADKLLLISGFLSLSFMGHLPPAMRIPAWLTILVIARDGLILIGSIMIFLITGRLKASPLFIGKITTVLQMGTLFLSLVSAPQPLRTGIFIMTGLMTLISGIYYTRMGGGMLHNDQTSQ